MAGFRTVDPIALARIIEESGVEHRTNGRSFIFTCPRCDKRDKLMMFKADGRFVCWVCAEISNFRGRPEYALAELLPSLSLKEIQDKIYGDSHQGIQAEDFFQIQLEEFFPDRWEIPPDLIALARGMPWPLDFHPIDQPHAKRGLAYLEKRGIGLELAKSYGLRYCPPQQRVIFPIMFGAKLLGWQARAVFDTEWEDEDGELRSAPKILTTGKRDQVVMFADRLVGSEHAVICEGPVDALKAHLCGGNIATMGKVVSRAQLDLIRKGGVKRVYLALDPDAALETMRLCSELGDLDLYRLLPSPGHKDLGDMTPEQVRESFDSAPRVFPGQVFVHFRGSRNAH